MVTISISTRGGSWLHPHRIQLNSSSGMTILSNICNRAENQVVFVKSTIFKNKIYSRSEIDIKLYFKVWLQDMAEKGLLDAKYFRESRKRRMEGFLKERQPSPPFAGVSMTCKETCPSMLSEMLPPESMASPQRV